MNGVSHEDFLACLEQLEPVELEAVKLLRGFKETGQQPTNTEQVLSAIKQLKDYEVACEKASRHLSGLRPIPANEEGLVWTFPL